MDQKGGLFKMIINMPYFMKNEKWYTWTEEEGYKLTNVAPEEAVQSYDQFMKEIKSELNDDFDFEFDE
jgi:hypothetical protein